MPNYDYKCQKCSHKFEVLQPITAKPLEKCPKCGGSVKRLISAGAGFIFKGSGFYATDYKKPSKKSKTPDKCKGCKENKCEIKKEDKKDK